MIPDNARMKFRMDDFLRANLILGYQNTKPVCLPMDCVYVFLPETKVAYKKEIFSIHSLDFPNYFKDCHQNSDKGLLD
jgi:hypothetical protein